VAIHDGLVIAPDLSGYVHCLDARTGTRHWTYDTREEIVASPLIADGKVFVATMDGAVHVLALSREEKLLARNDFDEPICAAPVFANGVLYVVAWSKLFAIKAGK
jgi:outer membrane protein assembly factor BamB